MLREGTIPASRFAIPEVLVPYGVDICSTRGSEYISKYLTVLLLELIVKINMGCTSTIRSLPKIYVSLYQLQAAGATGRVFNRRLGSWVEARSLAAGM
jgi:hypothetical protein